MDEFTAAYLKAALWSSTNDDGEPLDKNYSIDDFDAETLVQMAVDCQKFQAMVHRFPNTIRDKNVAVESSEEYSCDARAGHDFWLTRNGHGAGFWDGDWKEPAATLLTETSKKFGEFNIWGDCDGVVHKM